MTAALGSDDAVGRLRGSTRTSTRSCSPRPDIAFVGSDGGVARVTSRSPVDALGLVRDRHYADGRPEPLSADDLLDCQRLLRHPDARSQPLNDGLDDHPVPVAVVQPERTRGRPARRHAGQRHVVATRGSPAWFETVGGDGGQSGFDVANPTSATTTTSTRRRRSTSTAPTRGRGWTSTTRSRRPTRRARSTCRSSPTRCVGGRVVHRPRARVADGRQRRRRGARSRRTATRCSSTRTARRAATGCRSASNLTATRSATAPGNSSSRSSVRRATTARCGRPRAPAACSSRRTPTRRPAVKFNRIDTREHARPVRHGISIDPTNPNHAWISYSGYDAYTPGRRATCSRCTYNPATHTAT